MELDGKKQNWMEWGLDWTGTDRNKLDQSARQREWIRLDLAGEYFRRLNWTVLHFPGLSQRELDLTRLHYPGLNWKVPYRTVSSLHLARLICTELHCTFPNETDKDCTALHVNVLHWTRPDRIALHSNGNTLKGLFWIAETAMQLMAIH